MPQIAIAAAGIIGTVAAKAAGFGALIASLAGTVLSAVVSVAFSGLTGKRPSARDPGVPVTIRQPVVPRKRVYGIKRVGGALVFAQLIDDRATLILIAAVSEGPVDRPLRIWSDDTLIWAHDGGGGPASGNVEEFGDYFDDWGDFVRLHFHNGSQNQADAYFVGRSSGGANAPVDSNQSQILSAPTGVTLVTAEKSETVGLGKEATDFFFTEISVEWTPPAGTVVQYLVRWQDANGVRAERRLPGTIEEPVEGGEEGETQTVALTSTVLGRKSEIALGAEISVAAQDTAGNWTDATTRAGGSDARGPTWTGDAIGTGVAYWAAELKWDSTRRKFPRGVPNITMELRGAHVTDPRGGAGYSANAASCIRHYLTDREGPGSAAPGAAIVGLGADPAEIDDTAFSVHANLSDETVPTDGGGSEARYSIDGVVSADEERAGTIEDMTAAAGSDLIYSGGAFRLVNGAVPPSTLTITDAMLAGPIDMTIERPRRDAFNTVMGEHEPPETDYISVTYPAVGDAAAVAADGQQIVQRLPQPFTNSSSRAQRIAKVAVAEGRKKRFPVLRLGLGAVQLEVGDVVTWARYGFDEEFRVDSVALVSRGADGAASSQPAIEVQLSEVDPGQFDMTQAELAPGAVSPGDSFPGQQIAPPVDPVYGFSETVLADGATRITSRVQWQPSPASGVRGYEVTWTVDGRDQGAFTTRLAIDVDRAIGNVAVRAVGESGAVSVRIFAVRQDDFTNFDTTAPGAPTSSAVSPLTLGAAGEVKIRLDPAPEPDFARFRIYAAATNSAIADVTDSGTDVEFVTSLFHFYFDRDPAQAGLDFWVLQISSGALTRTEVAEQFAVAEEDAVLVHAGPETTITLDGFAQNREYRFFAVAEDRTGNVSDSLDLGLATPAALAGVDLQDGRQVALITVYRRFGSPPSGGPTGGTFDHDSLVIVAPSGASATVPANDGTPLYAATTVSRQPPDDQSQIAALTGWSDWSEVSRDGADGADGVSPQVTLRLEVFARAASQPATPSGGSYDIATGVLTPPSGWGIDDPGGSDPLWASAESFVFSGDTGTVPGGTWSAPIKRAEDGVDGLNGTSAAQIRVWLRSSITPATPSGGSFDFGSGALTPPAGWAEAPPDSTGDPADLLWSSVATATATLPTMVDNSLSWSVPAVEARDGLQGPQGPPGVDGVDGNDGTSGKPVASLTVYRRDSTVPASPTGGSFDFGTVTLTPPSGWSGSIPAADGDPLYAASTIVEGQTPTDVVAVSGWSAPQLFAADGADGTAPQVRLRITVFARAASQPATPIGGSFDIATGVLTPPAGWGIDDPGGSDPLWASSETFLYSGDTGTVSGGTWSPPVKTVEDGVDGLNGVWAVAVSVYRLTTGATPTAPAGGVYDVSAGELTTEPADWTQAVPDLTTSGNIVRWRSTATATGTLPAVTDSSLTWSAPVRDGKNGSDGAPGPSGPRGAGKWDIPVVDLPATPSQAATIWDNWADKPSASPIKGDQAWFFTGPQTAITGQSVWIFNGPTNLDWVEQSQVIDGNLLVTGTFTADELVTSGVGDDAHIEIGTNGANQIKFYFDTFNPSIPLFEMGMTSTSLPILNFSQISGLATWDDAFIRIVHPSNFQQLFLVNDDTSSTAAAAVMEGAAFDGDVLRVLADSRDTVAVKAEDKFSGKAYPNDAAWSSTEKPVVSISGERVGGVLQVFTQSSRGSNAACRMLGDYDGAGTSVTDYQTAVELCNGSGEAVRALAGAITPFTGAHHALIERTAADLDAGDIMVDRRIVARRGVSDTLSEVAPCERVGEATAIGVYAGRRMAMTWETLLPALQRRGADAEEIAALMARFDFMLVNALGEGQVNVCGRGGDLEPGDLIVTSDLAGKGQRQADDVLRSSTVARAREAASFSRPDEIRLVACIYLCG